jgi:hypothetical protein
MAALYSERGFQTNKTRMARLVFASCYNDFCLGGLLIGLGRIPLDQGRDFLKLRRLLTDEFIN